MRVGLLLTVSIVTACASGSSGTPIDAAPSCMLGTAEHCGACDRSCPGQDTSDTLRRCTAATEAATCEITCRAESYDVDGNATNGCEASDLPIQDSAASAVEVVLPGGTGGMSLCDGATNPCTVSAQILSDGRVHESAPSARPLGRDDWFQVIATGVGSGATMTACLNIGNYPADNFYEVCISDAGSMTPTTCGVATGGGGASACVLPSGNPNDGVFYVRIRRMAGTRTTNGYALYLEH